MSQNPTFPLNPNTLKFIFTEIQKYPVLWRNKNKSFSKTEKYWKLVVDQALATGILLTVTEIRKLFQTNENELNARLKRAIVDDRLLVDQMEKELEKWDMYEYVKFCRGAQNGRYEKSLWKRQAEGIPETTRKRKFGYQEDSGVPKKVKLEVEEDCGVSDETERKESDSHSSSTESDIAQESHRGTPEIPKDPEGFNRIKEEIDETEQHLESTNDAILPEQISETLHQSSRSSIFDVSTEIEYIRSQASRIVQERPESSKLLREMLLETIIAFDKNDFENDLGKFYRKLAEKHSK